MKSKFFAPLLTIGAFLMLMPNETKVLASTGYGGGSGTESDPYLILTPEHLNQLQLDVNVNGVNTSGKYYQLTTDIDLSGYDNDSDESNGNFTPIGNSYSIAFKGTFDGNGKVISNLEIILPEQNYVGLFGYASSATIQNLGLEDALVEGTQYVGGLVGYQVGGTISESYSSACISGGRSLGGLVGDQGGGTINQSYAIGKVSGRQRVGGLVGYQSSSAIVENSYWNVETTGKSSSKGGIGLTTKQMTKRNAKRNMTGFDFDTVWQESNGYPLLHWQTPDPISGSEEDVAINGNIEATILSLTIPSNSMSFILNPNEEVGKQFIASDFELINGSQTPLTLEVKSFEQVTDVLNDVESMKYSDWNGLNKTQSKDIALALVPKVGEGWLSLNEGNRWVADLGEPVIGTIKGNSTVSFRFEAKHGLSFTETLTSQYKLTFVFGLQD